jgi:phage RecT family recombinase
MAARTEETKPKPKTIFDLLADPRVQKGLTDVASRYLDPERLLRLCVNAVKKNPKLARCDTGSLLGSMMTSAALGLEPNTVTQEAFLIPYDNRRQIDGTWRTVTECQFQIGYRGWIKLADRAGYRRLQAQAIHAGDLFEHMQGSEVFLKYRKALKDRGLLIGSFCHTLREGLELCTVLPLEEIQKIRGRSQTWRSLDKALREAEASGNEGAIAKAEAKLCDTPWVLWLDDMAAKSAIKKHCKTLAGERDHQLSAAASIDDMSMAGVLDLSAMAKPDIATSTVEDGIDPPVLEDLSQDGTTLSEMGAQATASDLNERLRAKAASTSKPKPAEPESKLGGEPLPPQD